MELPGVYVLKGAVSLFVTWTYSFLANWWENTLLSVLNKIYIHRQQWVSWVSIKKTANRGETAHLALSRGNIWVIWRQWGCFDGEQKTKEHLEEEPVEVINSRYYAILRARHYRYREAQSETCKYVCKWVQKNPRPLLFTLYCEVIDRGRQHRRCVNSDVALKGPNPTINRQNRKAAAFGIPLSSHLHDCATFVLASAGGGGWVGESSTLRLTMI